MKIGNGEALTVPYPLLMGEIFFLRNQELLPEAYPLT